MFIRILLILALSGTYSLGYSQTLNLPARNITDQVGSQIVSSLTPLNLRNRELYILDEVMKGNVPDFYRNMALVSDSTLINGNYKTITYYTIPDYMALGSDSDYFLCPMTPILGQVIADSLSCILPTAKMVDQIWSNATVKMQPQTIAPSPQMTTVPVFSQHNDMVGTSRQAFLSGNPLGELVGGDKKDVIISNLIYTSPAPARVVIYGWHYPSGGNIQPKYAGHIDTYADYSHGIRLVQDSLWVDGVPMLASDVLMSATLYPLLSDEGQILMPYYPDTTGVPPIVQPPIVPKSFCVLNESATTARIIISNDPNVDQYEVVQSVDGITFGNPSSYMTNDFVIDSLSSQNITYFKISASNSAGTSAASEVLAVVPSDTLTEALIVNGFDRATAGNSYDFIRQHGAAFLNHGTAFSSATNDAVINGLVSLNNYLIADYILGEESTADETFSSIEQPLVQTYLDSGGYLFVSGAEIGWELDNLGSSTDKAFYNNYLKAQYVYDSPNNEVGVYYEFQEIVGSTFDSIGNMFFDDGTNGTYNVKYPDVLDSTNGGIIGLNYSNLSNNGAGIYFEGLFPNALADTGKLVYFGFPFETVYPESDRFLLMGKVLDFFLSSPDLIVPPDTTTPPDTTNPPDTSVTIGIHEWKSNNFAVYPNPFSDQITITINSENGSSPSLHLFDLSGKLMVEAILTQETTKIDLRDLPRGIYFLRVSSAKKSNTVKLIKYNP